MIGENTILVGGKVGVEFSRRLKGRYDFVHVPDMEAANCVLVNDVVLRRSDKEFPRSASVFKRLHMKQISVEGDELAKVDGALTCCSILF